MAQERVKFWRRAWRSGDSQRSAHPTQPDLADMGTAFGLDATFDLPAKSAGSNTPKLLLEPETLESDWAANRLNGRSVI